VGNTAILPQQWPGGRPRSGFALDQTMATPAPVSITPGVFQPVQSSRVVEPAAGVKQTTTFRNASGEATDLNFNGARGKRRTVVAVAAIVGLAAAGLAITVLVTRPSPGKPAAPESAATTPAPEPEPVPAPKFTPPPAVPAFEPPPPAPAAEPTPPADESGKHRGKKGGAGKGKKGADQPTGKTADRPSPPAAPPPAAPSGKNNTERW
jgi:hypothetical protein